MLRAATPLLTGGPKLSNCSKRLGQPSIFSEDFELASHDYLGISVIKSRFRICAVMVASENNLASGMLQLLHFCSNPGGNFYNFDPIIAKKSKKH